MSFSGNPGEMKGWSLMVPWKYFPSTTCWPVRSGLLIPSSTMGRSLSPITWQHPTSCCVWWTMAPSCTPWGKFVSAGSGSSRSLYTCKARMWPQGALQQDLCRLPLTLSAHLSLTLFLSLPSLFPTYVTSLILKQVFTGSFFLIIHVDIFLLCGKAEVLRSIDCEVGAPPDLFLFLTSDGIWIQVSSVGKGTLGWKNSLFSSSLRTDPNLFSMLRWNCLKHLISPCFLVRTMGLFFLLRGTKIPNLCNQCESLGKKKIMSLLKSVLWTFQV